MARLCLACYAVGIMGIVGMMGIMGTMGNSLSSLFSPQPKAGATTWLNHRAPTALQKKTKKPAQQMLSELSIA